MIGVNCRLRFQTGRGNEKDLIENTTFRVNYQTDLNTTEKARIIKVGLGISRTNADSQWNPVYNVFHRNFCCGNETIRRYFCKRDLDAANLWPALEPVLRKANAERWEIIFPIEFAICS